MLYRFKNKEPIIGEETYVSDQAVIIGDVKIGNNCYIGPGAILRGDYGTIIIGNSSAIEDGVVIHAFLGGTCSIGNEVIIGHGAIIHSKSIGDSVMVGMGAILSIDAQVGAKTIIAEGTVVRKKQLVPPAVIVGGNPAEVIKPIIDENQRFGGSDKNLYVNLARECLSGDLTKIDFPRKK